MRTLSQIPEEEIKEIISQSESYSQVMNKLNVNRNGGNQVWLKNFITINNLSVDHFKQNRPKEKSFCLNCGKEINKRNSYCNNTCYAEYKHKQYIERWKQGKETGIIGEDGIATSVRKYMFEKNNNSCEICGWCETNLYTGLIPLQIHHIDGDCTNNSEENLQLLCPNCHALTENFGSRNTNCTRIDKRVR